MALESIEGVCFMSTSSRGYEIRAGSMLIGFLGSI